MTLAALSVLCLALAADDVVVVSSAANPQQRTKKTGVILDFLGAELRLRTTLGTEERIPTARIVLWHTTWTPPHEAARAARNAGRFDDAIAAFREAKGAETRPWAGRQISAELSGCYLDARQIEPAVNEFLSILAADPNTRHIDSIPVAWRPGPDDPALEARASKWLELRAAPAVALIGASWLLTSPRRTTAIAALEELQNGSDPRIAGLAATQLWRTKLTSATLDDTRRWHAQLEKMPAAVQPVGWFILGEVYARQDQPQHAALAYLKLPLLYREQRAIGADALLAAGGQIEKMTQAGEAAGLYRELVRDFPGLPAAAAAQTRLNKPRGAGP